MKINRKYCYFSLQRTNCPFLPSQVNMINLKMAFIVPLQSIPLQWETASQNPDTERFLKIYILLSFSDPSKSSICPGIPFWDLRSLTWIHCWIQIVSSPEKVPLSTVVWSSGCKEMGCQERVNVRFHLCASTQPEDH